MIQWPHLSIYKKQTWEQDPRSQVYSHVYSSIIHNGSYLSVHSWVTGKESVVRTYSGIVSLKSIITRATTWLNPKGMMWKEIGRKGTNIMWLYLQTTRAVRFTEAESKCDCRVACLFCVWVWACGNKPEDNSSVGPLRLKQSLLPFAAVCAKLAGPQASEDSVPSPSHLTEGVQDSQMHDLPQLHTGSGDLNCVPLTCTAGTLSTQPLELTFNMCMYTQFQFCRMKRFPQGMGVLAELQCECSGVAGLYTYESKIKLVDFMCILSQFKVFKSKNLAPRYTNKTQRTEAAVNAYDPVRWKAKLRLKHRKEVKWPSK